ncbi:MAG TPA: M13-type metalloendopeptidase, partial [Corynebacterium sp.]|nr:M13-type metalloendopeptidase [Corynebacterium sp.]
MKDLYAYVNGPWLESHTIPEDRGVDGTFHQLRDEAELDVRALVETDSGRAGTLYGSFLDVAGVNAAGMAPLDADLDLLTASNAQGFAHNLGLLERSGVGAPLTFWVTKDSSSDTSVAYLVQSGIGLPDEAYYREEAHAETLAAYEKHIAEMLGFLDPARLFGLDAATAAYRIVALEQQIAAGHWDVVSTRDALKTYNPTEFADLPSDVRALLGAAGLAEGRIIDMMPSYTRHFEELLRDDNLADWQLWGTWHILRSRAALLPEEVGAKNFEFYGTRLSGATQQRDRWKRGVSLTESLVGHEVGQAFVAAHFPPSSKDHMLTLVEYLTRAYRQRINQLPWMTEETKARALAKLELFRAKIGYPETWRSYAGLEFQAGGAHLLENVRAGAAFLHDYEVAKIGTPADRDEWVTTPQTVNAFYNPVVNDITFPAAILRPPFYDPEAPQAENFGAIGAVIGHEIGHGFDDQGSQYDGHGNLESWWSDEDRAEFKKLTDQLVEQFDGLVPRVLEGTDTTGVNGEFTLGENIGDLGGLGIAVVAYQMWIDENGEEEPARFEADGAEPGLNEREFTGMQRLFLSW